MQEQKIEPSQAILIQTLCEVLGERDWCFALSKQQNLQMFNGLLPALVIRGIPGEQVLAIPLGQEIIVTLGNDRAKAQEQITSMNASLGYTETDIKRIYQTAGLMMTAALLPGDSQYSVEFA